MRSRLEPRVLVSVLALAAALLAGLAWIARDAQTQSPRRASPGGLRQAREVEVPGLASTRGEVRPGQAFRTSLTSAGIAPAVADTILNCLGRVGFDFTGCRPGEAFVAKTDSTGELHGFTYTVDRVSSWRITRARNGALAAARHTEAVELDTVAIAGALTYSVYKSIIDLGETPELVAAYADVLGYDIDFVFDPREGDRFRILFEKKLLDGEAIGYGRLLAATYDGAETGRVAGYWFADTARKISGWFSPDGGNLARAFMRAPLSILRVTSGFGMRTHPISGRRKLHAGTDYGAPTGTPAWSVAAGTVTFAGNRGGYGKLVEVSHAGGVRTRYGHLSKILVRRGQAVRQRQTVGLVGSTGYSTGPHLHFEYIVGGRQVAPRSIKNPPLQRIPKEGMGRFAEHMKAVDGRWERMERATNALVRQ